MYPFFISNLLPISYQEIHQTFSFDLQKPIMRYINNLNPTYFPIPVIRGSRYLQNLANFSDADTVVLVHPLCQKQARGRRKSDGRFDAGTMSAQKLNSLYNLPDISRLS